MPLPAPNTAWPPAPLANITPKLIEWDAWWSGDPAKLVKAYQGSAAVARPLDRPSQWRGGVVGAVARMWWGKPTTDLTVAAQRRIHVPIAGDLCQASADLLFADAPIIEATHEPTQARITQYLDAGLIDQLAEAAEIGAALGSSWLRVAWDRALSDLPILSPVDADAAWPEYRHGILTAVTFWWVVRRTDNRVWRHLERHELDAKKDGVILHGLYEGDTTSLGHPVPLTDTPALAGLAASLEEDGQTIHTRSPGLAVVHIPNQRPSRVWRDDPIGRHMGRSDLEGVEPLMDALDEAWSSWMRDLANGKGRIIAAESVLDDNGPGAGVSFDAERSVFTPIRTLTPRDATGLPLEVVQFAIRVQEHKDTCAELVTQILRSAGYSAQTFGDGGVVSMTATEVDAREGRSLLTRDRKVRAWGPGVLRAVRKMLAVDQALLGAGQLQPETVSVTFPDAVQETPLDLAQTASAWRTAEAASDATIVAYIHPDWSAEQVDEEVALIQAQRAADAPPDPFGPIPGTGPAAPVNAPA